VPQKKKHGSKKTKKFFAEGPLQTLGKEGSCRGQAGGPSAKLPKVTLCRGLALGKDVLCRVPEIRPSAKQKTLGSVAVSSSDTAVS